MNPSEVESSVVLAYLHTFDVTTAFADSVFRTFEYEAEQGSRRLYRTVGMSASTMNIDTSRNDVVKLFLDSSDREWLWFVDSDIGFPSNTLERLQTAALENDLHITSGLYFGRFDGEYDGKGGFHYRDVRPQIYRWNQEEQRFEQPSDMKGLPEGLLPVDGVGAGCLLIRRGVLERMRAELGDAWFNVTYLASGKASEDLSFCLRARELGYDIVVDTELRLNHQKVTWI